MTEEPNNNGAGSLVDRILKNLSSEQFSQGTAKLIDILKGQGRSQEEIEKALGDLQASDQAHLEEIGKQEEIIKAAKEKVAANDAAFLKLRQAEAQLTIEDARIRGRISERDAALADLEKSIADRQQAIDERQQEIDSLKKELGL